MPRIVFTKDAWLASMAADGAAFRTAIGEADLASSVPSCPGWTVTDLVHHLGNVYRYVTAHITRGVTTTPEKSRDTFTEQPPAADLLAWWDGTFATLTETLTVLEPNMPAWAWGPQAKNVGFWQRRMAIETALHRWDAQMSIGMAEPIEAKLASDGVGEALDTWIPAGRRIEHPPVNKVAALRATDIDYTWVARLRGEGLALLDTDTIFDDDHKPAVTAAGPASDILLALWSRIGLDVLDIEGDEDVLTALLVADRIAPRS